MLWVLWKQARTMDSSNQRHCITGGFWQQVSYTLAMLGIRAETWSYRNFLPVRLCFHWCSAMRFLLCGSSTRAQLSRCWRQVFRVRYTGADCFWIWHIKWVPHFLLLRLSNKLGLVKIKSMRCIQLTSSYSFLRPEFLRQDLIILRFHLLEKKDSFRTVLSISCDKLLMYFLFLKLFQNDYVHNFLAHWNVRAVVQSPEKLLYRFLKPHSNQKYEQHFHDNLSNGWTSTERAQATTFLKQAFLDGLKNFAQGIHIIECQ